MSNGEENYKGGKILSPNLEIKIKKALSRGEAIYFEEDVIDMMTLSNSRAYFRGQVYGNCTGAREMCPISEDAKVLEDNKDYETNVPRTIREGVEKRVREELDRKGKFVYTIFPISRQDPNNEWYRERLAPQRIKKSLLIH